MESSGFSPSDNENLFDLNIQLGELQVAALLSSRVSRLLDHDSLSIRLYSDGLGQCFTHDGQLLGHHDEAAALIDSINVLVQGNIQREPWPEHPPTLPVSLNTNTLFQQAAGIIFTEYTFATRHEAELTLMLYGYLTGKTTAILGKEIVDSYQATQLQGLQEFESELSAHGRPPKRR